MFGIISRLGRLSWPGSAGQSMIGECRWVLQCFPYRHWISSPPLKLLLLRVQALPAPGQFSRQVATREGGQDEVFSLLFGFSRFNLASLCLLLALEQTKR